MKLDGKIALVTGSSRGIGRAIGPRFASDGADVVVHYRGSVEGAHRIVGDIEATGRRARAVRADVGSVAEVGRLFQEAIAQFGRLDVLVNNAGVERRAAFWDVTEEDYDHVRAVNLKAVFFASQEMVRHSPRRMGGRKLGGVRHRSPARGPSRPGQTYPDRRLVRAINARHGGGFELAAVFGGRPLAHQNVGLDHPEPLVGPA